MAGANVAWPDRPWATSSASRAVSAALAAAEEERGATGSLGSTASAARGWSDGRLPEGVLQPEAVTAAAARRRSEARIDLYLPVTGQVSRVADW
jgi:hypothetical protein